MFRTSVCSRTVPVIRKHLGVELGGMPVFVSYGIIGRDLNDVQMLFVVGLFRRRKHRVQALRVQHPVDPRIKLVEVGPVDPRLDGSGQRTKPTLK